MERRRYLAAHGALLLGICALYGLNRFVLSPGQFRVLRRLLTGHFADLLAGMMALAIAALLMELGRLPRLNLPVGLAVLALASLIWEVLAPIWKPSAVFDWWDIFCYFVGGSGYALFRRWLGNSAVSP